MQRYIYSIYNDLRIIGFWNSNLILLKADLHHATGKLSRQYLDKEHLFHLRHNLIF